MIEKLDPLDDSRAPACRHYGVCGGCTMQVLKEPAYLRWKREGVADVLRTGVPIETQLNEIVPVGEGSRRRAVFGARRTKKTVQVGYRKRASHDLVDINECPVLLPLISDNLPALRKLLRPLLSRKGIARVTVLACENGLDIAVDDVKPVVDMSLREQVVALAREFPVARLVVNDEPLVEFSKPFVRFAGFEVNPPPKGFLQATQTSQQAMIATVLEMLPAKPRQIVDLFAGLGTFTLPLAQKSEVLAVEMDIPLLNGLQEGANRASGLKTIKILQRDLFKMPLAAFELREIDTVVLDPPRGGAKAQISELAQSDVTTIIYVSCNPISFKNDALVLIEAGFELKCITPFDQFLYTSHVEVIGHFVKK